MVVEVPTGYELIRSSRSRPCRRQVAPFSVEKISTLSSVVWSAWRTYCCWTSVSEVQEGGRVTMGPPRLLLLVEPCEEVEWELGAGGW